jgi:hypothetical protein
MIRVAINVLLSDDLYLRVVIRKISDFPASLFRRISNVETISPLYSHTLDSLYPRNSVLATADSSVYLAEGDEAKLSFGFDTERKVMVFNWRKVLTEIFLVERKVRRTRGLELRL